MDVQFDLAILDFSMHKKGFSVQRCEAAVREALTREFGAMPMVFYAPLWVAQYIPTGHPIQTVGGGYEAARLVKERIASIRAENPNARVLVASYNYFVREAAKEASALYGIPVGTVMLADYVYLHNVPQNAKIEWSGTAGSQATATPSLTSATNPLPAEILAGGIQSQSSGNDVQGTPDPYKRSREMRAPLLKAKIFNEKPVRDLLFKTVKSILPREHFQFSKLRRTIAEESFASSGFTDRGKWDTQVYFFCRLLLVSGTVVGPEGPIVHGAGSDGIEVLNVSPTVEDDAEAYLVEYVVRELGNVTEFEHCPLAHAVLRSFDAEVDIYDLKDRIAFLISKFADRLSLSDTGTYNHQAATKAPAALRAVK